MNNQAPQKTSLHYQLILKAIWISSIILVLYGCPPSYGAAIQVSPSKSPPLQPIRNDRDLFYAIDKLNRSKQSGITNLILRHRQHVTSRLWQWVSTQASILAKIDGPRLTSSRYKMLLTIAQVIGDDRLIGISYYNIGRHLILSRKYQEAIEAYKLSCTQLEKNHYSIEQLQVLGSLSQAYITIGDIDEARKHAERILNIVNSQTNITSSSEAWSKDYVTANAWLALATIEYRKGEHLQAIPKYLEALDLYQRSETFPPLYGVDICNTLNSLGEIYSIIGNHRLAFKYLTQSLELARNRALRLKEIETLLNLGSLYLKQDN